MGLARLIGDSGYTNSVETTYGEFRNGTDSLSREMSGYFPVEEITALIERSVLQGKRKMTNETVKTVFVFHF